jgi:serine/threonine protein kinase
MRESDKEWVLADFGLAAYTNQKYLYDKCGTMGFIAPEILAENKEETSYTSSCDLYSLGVVAYNLILGCLPFKVEVLGMYDRKYTWDAFSKSEILGLDEEILALLKGLLEKDPSKRWNPSQALASGLFTNPQVVERWRDFNKKKIEEGYNKVLKLKNRNEQF